MKLNKPILLLALLLAIGFIVLQGSPKLASVASPACFSANDGVHSIIPSCSGGTIVSNNIGPDGCNYITCTNVTNYLVAKACNKPGDYNPTYFEMYKYNASGANMNVCLDNTCVGTVSGYATSKNYTTCAPPSIACPSGSTGTYPGCVCTAGTYQTSTNVCAAVVLPTISFTNVSPAVPSLNVLGLSTTHFSIAVNGNGIASTRAWTVNGVVASGNVDDLWWAAPNQSGVYNVLVTVTSASNTLTKSWAVNVTTPVTTIVSPPVTPPPATTSGGVNLWFIGGIILVVVALAYWVAGLKW